jgi:hypothetical protein
MDDVLKVSLRKASSAQPVANGHGRNRRAQSPAPAPAKRSRRPGPRSITPSLSVRPRLTH